MCTYLFNTFLMSFPLNFLQYRKTVLCNLYDIRLSPHVQTYKNREYCYAYLIRHSYNRIGIYFHSNDMLDGTSQNACTKS